MPDIRFGIQRFQTCMLLYASRYWVWVGPKIPAGNTRGGRGRKEKERTRRASEGLLDHRNHRLKGSRCENDDVKYRGSILPVHISFLL
jgi:hypothetical protein